MSKVGVGAITLDAAGGGVAGVSRLIWQVLRDAWEGESSLVTLLSADRTDVLQASRVARVRFGMRLAAAQATGNCDWIFFSHLAVARVQQYVPKAVRKPYAIFLHGIEAWRDLSVTQRRVLEGASLLTSNSKFTADRIAAAHPWLQAQIHPCPLALSPRAVNSNPATVGRQYSHRFGRRDVLLVGRLLASERYKGHDQLLEAWPAVVKAVADARLVFVGDGDDVSRLEQKARDLGIADSVIFAGFLSEAELTQVYRNAALLAMPSREEGFGLAYLEAMSHQLPCIGSRQDAARDIIVDGITGYLVDQSAIRMLSERLITLLSDDARRMEMGRRGYDRWAQCFSYERFRDRLLSLVSTTFGEPHKTAIAS